MYQFQSKQKNKDKFRCMRSVYINFINLSIIQMRANLSHLLHKQNSNTMIGEGNKNSANNQQSPSPQRLSSHHSQPHNQIFSQQLASQNKIKLRTIFKNRGGHDSSFYNSSGSPNQHHNTDNHKQYQNEDSYIEDPKYYHGKSRVQRLQQFINKKDKDTHNVKNFKQLYQNSKKNRSLTFDVPNSVSQANGQRRQYQQRNFHKNSYTNPQSPINMHYNHNSNRFRSIQDEDRSMQLKKSSSAKYANPNSNILSNYKINNSSIQIPNINPITPKNLHNSHSPKAVTYQQLLHKLSEIETQAQILIKQKIKKMAKKSDLITLRTKGKDEISEHIQALIEKIKAMSVDQIVGVEPNQVKTFMDKKIRILEKLLAGNSTQSEVLKKYYFAINAINQRNKSNNSYRSYDQDRQYSTGKKLIKSQSYHSQQKAYALQKLKQKYQSSKNRNSPMVCDQSCFKLEYPSPKPNQYETYRYKNKAYNPNLQPLPRSSYKRQFLIYNPDQQNFSCKNFDNNVVLKSRLVSSTYNKDFQKLKTQIVDYKELDSYKNKIKSIQVSYINQSKKKQTDEFIEKSKKYITEQLKQKYNQKNFKYTTNLMMSAKPKYPIEKEIVTERDLLNLEPSASNLHGNSRLTETQQNMFLNSQFKSQFKGRQNIDLTKIKNQNLQNLKYSYKNMING